MTDKQCFNQQPDSKWSHTIYVEDEGTYMHIPFLLIGIIYKEKRNVLYLNILTQIISYQQFKTNEFG